MSDSGLATRAGTTVSSPDRVPAPVRNAMTVDVEDYFHAEALSACFPVDGWDLLESRVEANVDQLLVLFAAAKVTATFFILGWVAERYPRMVVAIADAGHEIASHGYNHRRVDRQQRFEFEEDIRRATAILEDVSGQAIVGYRAPTFSITRNNFWAFDVLENAGYRYSSSIFPIRHDNYGIHDAPRFPFHPPNSGIIEHGTLWNQFSSRRRRIFSPAAILAFSEKYEAGQPCR